jgi:hypothetical protein
VRWMEWVSHLAGEPHSDEPACVSPVLRAFCTSLNDGLEDIPRQRLRTYLPRTISTSGDGLDDRRGWMAMDWLIRVHTPTWLSAAGLTGASARRGSDRRPRRARRPHGGSRPDARGTAAVRVRATGPNAADGGGSSAARRARPNHEQNASTTAVRAV